jgi:hypothetical protein
MIKDRVLSPEDKIILSRRSTTGLMEMLRAIEKITETETPMLFSNMKQFIIDELHYRKNLKP